MHDQRIGVRHVETGFDDRGRQQDVIFAFVERRHHVFEFGRRHLSRGAGEDEIGHRLAQKLRNVVEIGNARRDVIGLPAAEAFAPERFFQNDRIERRNECAHRHAIDGRRGDQRQLAHTG